MPLTKPTPPRLVLTYNDHATGVRGHLVIDRLIDGLCAGGMRIREGVDAEELAELAWAMTRKQAAVGLSVGGAKAGIDMPPDHPERGAILRRFIAALRPFFLECWITGPDMNITIPEIEIAARSVGIPSVKVAISAARGIPREVFLERVAALETRVHGWTVNQLRAPAAVATSCMVLARHLGIEAPRVAIQGAGHMGRGTAIWLERMGARVVAWADSARCISGDGGLDVARLARAIEGGLLPADAGETPSSHILEADADILVLAAISRALDMEQGARLRTRGIVEAANLALDHDVENALFDRGVLVVPDALASAGGSLASEALYQDTTLDGAGILDHVHRRTQELVGRLLEEVEEQRSSPRTVVERWIAVRLEALDHASAEPS